MRAYRTLSGTSELPPEKFAWAESAMLQECSGSQSQLALLPAIASRMSDT